MSWCGGPFTVDSNWAADSDSDAGDLQDTRNTAGDTKDARRSVQAAESGRVVQVKSKSKVKESGSWYIIIKLIITNVPRTVAVAFSAMHHHSCKTAV